MYFAYARPREPHVVPVRGGMYRGRDIFDFFLSVPALPFVGSARSASKPPAPRRHHPAARLARLGKGRPGGLTGFGLRRIDGGYLDTAR